MCLNKPTTVFLLIWLFYTSASEGQRFTYVGVDSQTTWDAANSYCASTFGTTLATITTSEENTEIRNHAPGGTNKFFIGLYQTSGEWKWIDGTTSAYRYTFGVSGDGTCAEFITSSDTWNDLPCDYSRYFVCNNKTWVPTVNPTPMPTGVTNEPTKVPSHEPSNMPSFEPSFEPSGQPSSQPSNEPSSEPSDRPSMEPSDNPSYAPSKFASDEPTMVASKAPSKNPTQLPTTASDSDANDDNSNSSNSNNNDETSIFSNDLIIIVLIVCLFLICVIIVVLIFLYFDRKHKRKEKRAQIEMTNKSNDNNNNNNKQLSGISSDGGGMATGTTGMARNNNVFDTNSGNDSNVSNVLIAVSMAKNEQGYVDNLAPQPQINVYDTPAGERVNNENGIDDDNDDNDDNDVYVAYASGGMDGLDQEGTVTGS